MQHDLTGADGLVGCFVGSATKELPPSQKLVFEIRSLRFAHDKKKGLNQFRISPLFTSLESFKDKLRHYNDAISGNFIQPLAASILSIKLALRF